MYLISKYNFIEETSCYEKSSLFIPSWNIDWPCVNNKCTFLNVILCRRRLWQIVSDSHKLKWLSSKILGGDGGRGVITNAGLGTTVLQGRSHSQSTKTWRYCYLSLPLGRQQTPRQIKIPKKTQTTPQKNPNKHKTQSTKQNKNNKPEHFRSNQWTVL